MSEKGYMPSLSQIRNAYSFLYGVDEEDPGRALEEAGEDFDRWLDAHTESVIRRATAPKQQLDLKEMLEDCSSCWGTGVIDSAEHRCGMCAGRGYLMVYRAVKEMSSDEEFYLEVVRD